MICMMLCCFSRQLYYYNFIIINEIGLFSVHLQIYYPWQYSVQCSLVVQFRFGCDWVKSMIFWHTYVRKLSTILYVPRPRSSNPSRNTLVIRKVRRMGIGHSPFLNVQNFKLIFDGTIYVHTSNKIYIIFIQISLFFFFSW